MPKREVTHGAATSYKNGRCACQLCYEAGLKHARDYRAKRIKQGAEGTREVRHGTYGAYTEGCKCEKCMAANRDYKNANTAERRRMFQEGFPHVHGTPGGYGYGCRCFECHTANFLVDLKISNAIVQARIVDQYTLQRGRCFICGRKDKLQIDHDHVTMEVRGLICGLCNRGLGQMQDSIEILEKAVAYLKNPPLTRR